MKHTSTIWKDVETHLALLPLTEIFDTVNNLRVLHHVNNFPVQPCERQFNIETRIWIIKTLAVVDFIDHIKDLEPFSFPCYTYLL